MSDRTQVTYSSLVEALCTHATGADTGLSRTDAVAVLTALW